MNLKGETSNILSDYIMNVLKKHNLLNNVAFSGDNCNTNFGGISRKSTNNVFALPTIGNFDPIWFAFN